MKELDYDKMDHSDVVENLTDAFNTAFADEDASDEEIEMSKKLIEKISYYYMKKEIKATEYKNAKAKRRKASVIAKQSRVKNRKK